MSGLPKRLLLALVAAPLAAAAAWCVVENNQARLTAPSTPSKWTLDQTAAFGEYPVFYLGDDFEGLPLEGVIREVVDDNPDSPYSTERDGFIFFYGKCTIRGGNEGCAVPLSVNVMPRCYAPPPELFSVRLQGPIRAGLGGSEVQVLGEATYVWTGEVAVRIGGGGASHERAVEALRAINSPVVGSEVAKLSPPNKSACARIQGPDRDKVLSLSGVVEPTPVPTQALLEANEYSMEVNIVPATDAVGGATFVAQVSVVHGGVTVASGCFDGLVNGIDDDGDTVIDNPEEIGFGEPFLVPPFGCYAVAQWSVDYDQTLVDLLPLGSTGTTGIVRVAAAPSSYCTSKNDNGDRALAGCANISPPPNAVIAYTGPAFNLTFDCIAAGTAVFTLITAAAGETFVGDGVNNLPMQTLTDSIECTSGGP